MIKDPGVHRMSHQAVIMADIGTLSHIYIQHIQYTNETLVDIKSTILYRNNVIQYNEKHGFRFNENDCMQYNLQRYTHEATSVPLDLHLKNRDKTCIIGIASNAISY